MSQPLPKLVHTIAELRAAVAAARTAGKTIGFVPTMGALHEGHLSLVRAAKDECGFVVVSIYVNPSQFGPKEDFSKYPRTLDADMALLAGHADLVFAPSNEEVYPPNHATWVTVGSVAEPLEGACRPDHFRGVATIVLKLFGMVQPDFAYFGQKDYQQALVIERMTADLNVQTMIRVCPIVREPDGLAMSSRNRYLSSSDRKPALVLSQSLALAEILVKRGERNAAKLAARMREVIGTASNARIDYIAIVDPQTLQPMEVLSGDVLVALAVKISNTRLIDNRVLHVSDSRTHTV